MSKTAPALAADPFAPTPAPWDPVFVLSLLGFAMSTAETLPSSMMPLMSDGLHASEGMIGQATTATAIMAILTSLSVGRLAGSIDRRLILITFTGVLMLSNAIVALAPNVWTMLAARMLLGVTIGMNWGLIPSIVVRLAPAGRVARGLSIVMAGASMSGVISAPLAAFLGHAIGWRVVYLGATTLAGLGLLALVLRFPALPFSGGVVRRDLRGTLALPGMLMGMVGMVFIFGGAQVLFGYMVPFLEDITGFSPASVSIVLFITGIVGLSGTIAAPKSLSLSVWGVLVAATAIMAALSGTLLIVGSMVVPTVLALMIWAFFRSHVGVGANAWIAQSFSDHLEGAGGLLVAFIQGSMMLGAMLGGVLIDSQGAKAPVAASAVLLTVAAIWVFIVMRPTSEPAVSTEVVALDPTETATLTPEIVEEIA